MLQKKFLLVDDSETYLFINRKYIEIASMPESIVCEKSTLSTLQYLTTKHDDCIPNKILLDTKTSGWNYFNMSVQIRELEDGIHK